MFLEKQIKKVDGFVSGFEDKLSKDGVILNEENALQTRIQNLQVFKLIKQKKQKKQAGGEYQMT